MTYYLVKNQMIYTYLHIYVQVCPFFENDLKQALCFIHELFLGIFVLEVPIFVTASAHWIASEVNYRFLNCHRESI